VAKKMRVAAAGLLLAFAQEVGASGTGCPVVAPAGAWAPGAAYKAVSAGQPNATVPGKWSGFNRTVSLEGFCVDVFSLSTGWSCSTGGGELRAGLKATNGTSPVALNFAGVRCPLTAISAYKTTEASADFEAELRFEFEGCVAPLNQTAPVNTAAVVVGIRKDTTGADFNLVPWTKEVCKAYYITSTPPPASNVSVISAATEQLVGLAGGSTCDATVRRTIENIEKLDDCKMQCVGSATKAHILNGTGCSGYAYSADAKTCKTFEGPVNKVTTSSGWSCYNLTYGGASYSKSTPPPAPVAVDTTEILAIKEVLGLSTSAYLQHITPPSDAATCFAPMWWFTLSDRYTGKMQSVPVKEAHWDALMNRALPDAVKLPDNSEVSAPQILDRVVFDTCAPSNGWGQTACFVAPPKKTHCRDEEIHGAIISGVITSLLTYLMVGCWFCIYLRCGTKKSGYDPAAADESGQTGSRVCTHRSFQIGMCVTAVGGSCLSVWLSMQFLNAVMRSADCFDFAEFMVVIIAVTLATALAIIIFTLYMATFHPAHPHPILHTATKTERKSTKLMLVEVQDGTDVGHSLDSMMATKEDGRWTGFESMRSGMSGGSFSTMRPGESAMATPLTR